MARVFHFIPSGELVIVLANLKQHGFNRWHTTFTDPGRLWIRGVSANKVGTALGGSTQRYEKGQLWQQTGVLLHL